MKSYRSLRHKLLIFNFIGWVLVSVIMKLALLVVCSHDLANSTSEITGHSSTGLNPSHSLFLDYPLTFIENEIEDENEDENDDLDRDAPKILNGFLPDVFSPIEIVPHDWYLSVVYPRLYSLFCQWVFYF